MGLNVARVVLEGELGDVALPELVQLFCAARNSREIDVTFEGDHVGRLVVHGGRVVRCVAFGRVGLEAFFQLMQQRRGRYVVRVVSERSTGSIHPSLAEATWESLLIEAARRQDAELGASDDDLDAALSGFDAFVESTQSESGESGEHSGLLPPPMDATPHVSLPPVAPRAQPASSRRRDSNRTVPALRRPTQDELRRRDSSGMRATSVPPPVESAAVPAMEPERTEWEAPKPRRRTSVPPVASASAPAPVASAPAPAAYERPAYGAEWEPLASRPSSRAPRMEDARRPYDRADPRRPAAPEPPRVPPMSARASEPPPASGQTLDDVVYDPAAGVIDDAARTQVQKRRPALDPPAPRSVRGPGLPPFAPPLPSSRVPAERAPSSPARSGPVSRPVAPSAPPCSPPPPPASSGSLPSQSATILRERATEAYLRRDLHQALKLFEASLALAPADERSKANVARIKAKLGLR